MKALVDVGTALDDVYAKAIFLNTQNKSPRKTGASA
jgi:hypothetical protein